MNNISSEEQSVLHDLTLLVRTSADDFQGLAEHLNNEEMAKQIAFFETQRLLLSNRLIQVLSDADDFSYETNKYVISRIFQSIFLKFSTNEEAKLLQQRLSVEGEICDLLERAEMAGAVDKYPDLFADIVDSTVLISKVLEEFLTRTRH